MTGTGDKTGKQGQDSDNENGMRPTGREPFDRGTRIADGELGDSQRGDPERGLHVVLEQRSGRGSKAGDLRQDFDRYAAVREEEESKD